MMVRHCFYLAAVRHVKMLAHIVKLRVIGPLLKLKDGLATKNMCARGLLQRSMQGTTLRICSSVFASFESLQACTRKISLWLVTTLRKIDLLVFTGRQSNSQQRGFSIQAHHPPKPQQKQL